MSPGGRPAGQSDSEKVLDGRLVVNVSQGQRRLTGQRHYTGAVISIVTNDGGSMRLTPLELAALLDGPLARALDEANGGV